MTKPDILRLIEFQKMLLAFSQVDRTIHRDHKGTFILENDTEHSFNLAMTAWMLVEYFPHLDRDLVIRYALAHDLIEIHAGDTYIFADQAKLASKHEREMAAMKQLQREWSDFPDLLTSIEAYESRQSAEAKFVYALDKIMPIMIIFINQGYTWQIEGIVPEKLDSIKRKQMDISIEIKPYYEELYELLLNNRHLFIKETPDKSV